MAGGCAPPAFASPLTRRNRRRRTISSCAPAPAGTAELSPREQELSDLLARGYLYKEIAESMKMSVGTVNTYIRPIYEKLHVRSRAQAVAKSRPQLPPDTRPSRTL